MSKFLKLSLLGFASTVLFSCGTPEVKVETNVDSLAADTVVIDSAIVAADTTVVSLDSVQK